MKSPRFKHLPLRVLAILLASLLLFGSIGRISVAQQARQAPNGTVMENDTFVLLRAADYNAFTYVRPPTSADSVDQSPSAPQAATINVTYTGFSPGAQAAFQYAVDIWETLITSTVTIEVDAQWVPMGATSGILGGAGACYSVRNFTGAPLTNVRYPAPLADKLYGSDLVPATCDIIAQFNSDRTDWHLNPATSPPGGTYDLATVVLHELGHGLGFAGSMRQDDGNPGNGVECTGTAGDLCWGGSSGYPLIYDCFTADGNVLTDDNIINTAVYGNPSAGLNAILQSGSVYWGGINVTHDPANPTPNYNVLLFAPNPWEQGSSYSHWDEYTFGFQAGQANSLMTPYLAGAERIFDPGPMTMGLFDDIGWDGSGSAGACPSTPTAVTLKSMDASGGPQIQMMNTSDLSLLGNDNSALPTWLPTGLGVVAILGTSAWLIARRRTKMTQ